VALAGRQYERGRLLRVKDRMSILRDRVERVTR
jgi:hypothetical protein